MLDKNHFKNWFNKNFKFNKNEKISVVGKSSTYKAPEDVASDYLKICAAAALDTDWQVSDVLDVINTLKPKKNNTNVQLIPGLDKCASWIYSELQNKSCPYRINDKGNEITYNNNSVETNADSNNFLHWLWTKNRDNNLSYLQADIKAGLNNLLMEFTSICLSRIVEQIRYNEDNKDFTETFIKYLYDHLQIAEDYDIFNTLMKHWMWILKRRIFTRNVRHHMWINFYGATGIGKTEMIHRMFDFMKDFVAEPGIQIFSDGTREYKKFTENYVLFFEELAQADARSGFAEESYSDKGMAAMKQILTADYLDPRLLGGQDQVKVKCRFAPISVANEHLYDIIFDETSMRRFFDFTCMRKEAPKNFDELNKMLSSFPLALQGIDENNDEGYFYPNTTIGQKIKAIQKTYAPSKTSTNSWITYSDITPDNNHNYDTVFTVKEYNQYKHYCKSVGKYAASMDRVLSILTRLWPDAVDSSNMLHIRINKCCIDDNGTVVDTKHAKESAKFAEEQSIREYKDNETAGSFFNVLSDGSETTSDDVLFSSNTETRVNEKTSPELDYDDPKLSQKYAEAMAKQARNQFD